MNIGTTVPLMEPGWDRALFKSWGERIDSGPWSSLFIGEQINSEE
jgi:hypothetical protein